jgi:hypothetical protein
VIDTIRFTADLAESVVSVNAGEWGNTLTSKKERGGKPFTSSRRKHKPTGTRIEVTSKGTYIETSLARLLHGNNRWLIKNQRELNQALAKLTDIVRQLDPTYQGMGRIVRLDLCWHIPGDPRLYIEQHRNLTHPDTPRAKVIIYREETIIWESRAAKQQQRELRIQMYDKRKAISGKDKAGLFVRLELQMRGSVLSEVSPRLLNTAGSLSFKKCYRHLRETFCKFEDCDDVITIPHQPKAIKKQLHEFGVFWKTLLPQEPPVKFKKTKMGDVPDVPPYG